ncbi:MAG: branched-chain amino acid transaminase [Candidatus Dormibacteraeota bacterium]|nr:branched-chain amino acid transaminase [Candidatus Dormibacteraeota bacterium]MBO0762719.1 branched-chain amino acid transaminase [Candidatus Dormibacteraeota bacterium]
MPTPLPVVFVDGAFVESDEARLSVHANAVSYGTGVFEGIRAGWNERHQQLYLLEAAAHYDRMQKSARALGLRLPSATADLVEATAELLRRGELRADGYVRPVFLLSGESLAVGMEGIETRLSIAAWRMDEAYADPTGVRCIVSSWRRCPDGVVPVRAKVIGTYAGPALAKSEARAAGCDDAIMLTVDGNVAEATTSNLFLRRGGAWVTPPVTDDILEGITRGRLLQLIGEELSEPVAERTVDRSELYVADEVLLCGTAVEVVPVLEVDRRPVGDGEPGARTVALQRLLRQIARREIGQHAEWTTPVYQTSEVGP